jgi:simple sugar transport system permease protein
MSGVTTVLAGTVRLTTPLAMAGCGEQIAERSGTLNISIEAMMLAGAYFGIVGASVTGTVIGGLALGVAAGAVVAWIHANFSHRLNANTFVVGLTLNVLVLGLTSFLNETIDVTNHNARLVKIPGLRHIPWIGAPLFENRWTVYLLVPIIPFVWWLLNRTRWGLEVRASGEDPQAADVTGIDVNKRRRQSLYLCGLLAGLAGAHLAIGYVGRFNPNMTAGRGFVVNAAVIFGGWTLKGSLAGCLLFGGAFALELSLPALGYSLNPQLLHVAPYLLAILAMLFFANRNRKPAALAVPFERGIT